MMGQQSRKESLFYYFRREDQIPETHLLRQIDRYVDFSFVRDRLKGFYSQTGRPSIDPEVLLRLLLVGYLYGITSERRLLEVQPGEPPIGQMHAHVFRASGGRPRILAGSAPGWRRRPG